MSNINFLLSRQSISSLQDPAPDQQALEKILSAAVAVPDHRGLNPYHFHIATGKGLDILTQIWVDAVSIKTDDKFTIRKAERKAYRAPMIIIIATDYQDHPGVPKQEQLITAGCAAHAMQMAATALGYGAMWRTGDLAFDPVVKQKLGIANTNDIIGYLYIGTPSKDVIEKTRKPFNEFVSYLT